ncbi:uncharacterized protein PD653_2992 [Nocardioides sp. PD653]|nr:uncharacterized protein PD653B2_4907 [Nocardioides sp. PD653-B2]GAW55567.1 uncharacterized protein PD653_2992 [Nocardioides sp. PD653]
MRWKGKVMEQASNEVEPRLAYATVAARYWETYLPSRLATVPLADRRAFFEDLGSQVAQMVDYLAADNLRASSRPQDPPELTRRKATMARMRAEDEALAELVYLPKERGTKSRETPTYLTGE